MENVIENLKKMPNAKKIELAMEMVLTDAVEGGMTPSEFKAYIKTETYQKNVIGYVKLMM